jgi:hypothetical protein
MIIKTYTLIPGDKTKLNKKRGKKNTSGQTSRLENLEEL